ncbi:cupin domain-containing protein [Paenarthrobacter sp. RAF54_2]|uniref:cupin domain-containing protein n=1 Tax=Paenarthrobacter sp. RAF54_2 TaxID=3233061 RepID=UPI003F9B60D1
MTIHQNSTNAFENIVSSGLLVPPAATPLTGDIETWTNEVFTDASEASSVGFWQADVGRSHWIFQDYNEVIYVLAGRLVVTEEGGGSVHLGPGDVAVFPIGWRGEWDILEELKKFYVVFP